VILRSKKVIIVHYTRTTIENAQTLADYLCMKIRLKRNKRIAEDDLEKVEGVPPNVIVRCLTH